MSTLDFSAIAVFEDMARSLRKQKKWLLICGSHGTIRLKLERLLVPLIPNPSLLPSIEEGVKLGKILLEERGDHYNNFHHLNRTRVNINNNNAATKRYKRLMEILFRTYSTNEVVEDLMAEFEAGLLSSPTVGLPTGWTAVPGEQQEHHLLDDSSPAGHHYYAQSSAPVSSAWEKIKSALKLEKILEGESANSFNSKRSDAFQTVTSEDMGKSWPLLKDRRAHLDGSPPADHTSDSPPACNDELVVTES